MLTISSTFKPTSTEVWLRNASEL